MPVSPRLSRSTKVSVVDDTGMVHAAARSPLRPYQLSSYGGAVHPGDDLWDSLGRASTEALSRFAGGPRDALDVKGRTGA